MSQRRTAPSSLPEGGGLGPDGLSPESEITNGIFARQWVAYILGTLTMCLVGTVYEWTETSLVSLTTGSGDVPLPLTCNEYSWSDCLTVLSSMFGSLLAAQLADRIGRKYCLLACSIIFTLGWVHMFAATFVPMLYLARGILGIGVGIARTISPMFVSEITDIKFRGPISVLLAANVYTGSLFICILGHWLTYKSLLMGRLLASNISILLIMCLRETPYFLVAKGQKTQARKSIAYYKGIQDPDRVKIELRALRAEARYGLHQQSSSDLHSQSSSDLPPPYSSIFPLPSRSDLPPPYSSISPSPSRSDLPPPYSSNLSPPYSSNLPPPSRSDLPPPYSSNLSSQSIRETHSDPTRVVAGTEATSNLDSPSSSDSHSSVHSKFKCEIHTQPTGELRVEYSRDSPGLPLQTSRELHSQSTSDLHRPSASEVHRPSTTEIHPEPTREIQPEPTSEIHPEPTSEIQPEPTSEIHPEPTSEIHPEPTSEIHPEPTSEIHPEPTSEIHPELTSEIHRPSTRQIDQPSASQIHLPSINEMNQPSTNEINPRHTCEIQSRSRNTQYSVDSQASRGIPESYIDGTKYTCLDKLRAILTQRSNRKALFIMLAFIMVQQLSGNIIATQYLQELINRKITFISLYNATILVRIVRILSGYLTALITEWYGRRKLLILSTLGSCLSLYTLAVHVSLTERKLDHPIIHFLLFFDLLMYQVLFQIGLGMLHNTLLCDLFPTKLKGFVGAIVVIFDGIIGFTASKLNQMITDNLERSAIFSIFATSCFLAFLMVFIWVPETKGKTYHEIEAHLVGENLNSSNEEVSSDEMDIDTI